MKLVFVLIAAITLSGCSLFNTKKIDIFSTPVEKTPLNLENPQPLNLKPIEWIVITPDTSTKVWDQLVEKEQSVALFALTDHNYKKLAIDFAEIRVFVDHQRTIINKYKEYYEPKPVPKATK